MCSVSIREVDGYIQRQRERELAETTFEPRDYTLTDYLPYEAAHRRLQELQDKRKHVLAPAEIRVREAQEDLARAERAALEEQARAYQEDCDPDGGASTAVARARVELQRAQEGLEKTKHQIAALGLAIDRQTAAVKGLEVDARRHVRELARRDHAPVVKRLAEAAVAFAEALRDERAVVMGARRILGHDHGLAAELPPTPEEMLYRTPLERWLEALRAAGHGDLPDRPIIPA